MIQLELIPRVFGPAVFAQQEDHIFHPFFFDETTQYSADEIASFMSHLPVNVTGGVAGQPKNLEAHNRLLELHTLIDRRVNKEVAFEDHATSAVFDELLATSMHEVSAGNAHVSIQGYVPEEPVVRREFEEWKSGVLNHFSSFTKYSRYSPIAEDKQRILVVEVAYDSKVHEEDQYSVKENEAMSKLSEEEFRKKNNCTVPDEKVPCLFEIMECEMGTPPDISSFVVTDENTGELSIDITKQSECEAQLFPFRSRLSKLLYMEQKKRKIAKQVLMASAIWCSSFCRPLGYVSYGINPLSNCIPNKKSAPRTALFFFHMDFNLEPSVITIPSRHRSGNLKLLRSELEAVTEMCLSYSNSFYVHWKVNYHYHTLRSLGFPRNLMEVWGKRHYEDMVHRVIHFTEKLEEEKKEINELEEYWQNASDSINTYDIFKKFSSSKTNGLDMYDLRKAETKAMIESDEENIQHLQFMKDLMRKEKEKEQANQSESDCYEPYIETILAREEGPTVQEIDSFFSKIDPAEENLVAMDQSEYEEIY